MTDERRRNMKIVYGNLAYDLDTLVRERQLEEAGAMPERKAQPKEQTQPRRPGEIDDAGVLRAPLRRPRHQHQQRRRRPADEKQVNPGHGATGR